MVRILQNDYGVDPGKLVAAGRSFYMPIADNDSELLELEIEELE